MPRLRLVVHHGSYARRYDFRDKRFLVVGRGETSEVVIDDPSIDRCHAIFSYDDRRRRWSVEDRESTLGSSTGHIPLVPRQPRVLPPRCWIQLGTITLEATDPHTLRRVRSIAESAVDLHVALSRRGYEDFYPTRLVGLEGSAVSVDLVARSRPYLLGRTGFCEVRLDDPDLSPEQVALTISEEALPRVTNVGSSAIVRVGSRSLAPGESFPWLRQDMMQVGRYVFALWDLVRDVLDELDASELANETKLAGLHG